MSQGGHRNYCKSLKPTTKKPVKLQTSGITPMKNKRKTKKLPKGVGVVIEFNQNCLVHQTDNYKQYILPNIPENWQQYGFGLAIYGTYSLNGGKGMFHPLSGPFVLST